MKKRIVSMILALSMVLSILPVSAFADAGAGLPSAAAEETNSITYSSVGEHEDVGTNEETTNMVVKIKIGTNGLPKAASGTGWSYDETTGLTITSENRDVEYILDGTVSCNVTVKNANSYNIVYLLDGTVTGKLYINADYNDCVRVQGGTYSDVVLNGGSIKGGNYRKLTQNDGVIYGGIFAGKLPDRVQLDSNASNVYLDLPDSCTVNGIFTGAVTVVDDTRESTYHTLTVHSNDPTVFGWVVNDWEVSVYLPQSEPYGGDSVKVTVQEKDTVEVRYHSALDRNFKLYPAGGSEKELQFTAKGVPDVTGTVNHITNSGYSQEKRNIYIGKDWVYSIDDVVGDAVGELFMSDLQGRTLDFGDPTLIPADTEVNCHVSVKNGTIKNYRGGFLNDFNAQNCSIENGRFCEFVAENCTVSDSVIIAYPDSYLTTTFSNCVITHFSHGDFEAIEKNCMAEGQKMSKITVANGTVYTVDGYDCMGEGLYYNTAYVIGNVKADLLLSTDVVKVNGENVEDFTDENIKPEGTVLHLTGKNSGGNYQINEADTPVTAKQLVITENGKPDLTGVYGKKVNLSDTTAKIYSGDSWQYIELLEVPAGYIYPAGSGVLNLRADDDPRWNTVNLGAAPLNPSGAELHFMLQMSGGELTGGDFGENTMVTCTETTVSGGSYYIFNGDYRVTVKDGNFKTGHLGYDSTASGGRFEQLFLGNNAKVTGITAENVDVDSYKVEISDSVILNDLILRSGTVEVRDTVCGKPVNGDYLADGQQQSKLTVSNGTVTAINGNAVATDTVYLIGNAKAELTFSNTVTDINGAAASDYNGAQLSADGKTLTFTAKNDGEDILVNLSDVQKLPFSSLTEEDFDIDWSTLVPGITCKKDGVGKPSVVFVRTYDKKEFNYFPHPDVYGIYEVYIRAEEGTLYEGGELQIDEGIRPYKPTSADFSIDLEAGTATYNGPKYFGNAVPKADLVYNTTNDSSTATATVPTKVGTYYVWLVVENSQYYNGSSDPLPDGYTVAEKLPFKGFTAEDFEPIENEDGTYTLICKTADGVGELSLKFECLTGVNKGKTFINRDPDAYGRYRGTITAKEGKKYKPGSIDLGEESLRYTPVAKDFTYDATKNTVTYTGKNYYDADPDMTLLYGTDQSETVPTAPGSYDVYVKVTAGKNYIADADADDDYRIYQVGTYDVPEPTKPKYYYYWNTQGGKECEVGAPITLGVDKKEGNNVIWKIEGLAEDAYTITDTGTQIELQFFMPSNDVRVTNHYEPIFYTLTVDGKEERRAFGKEVTFTAPEKEGCTFTGWEVDGVPEGTDTSKATITFTMPANKVTLTPQYKKNTYTLTVDGVDEQRVFDDDVTVIAQPVEGKTFTGWKVTGLPDDVDTSKATITFKMPAKNVTLKAEYTENAPKTYKLDVTNAKVTLKDGGAVADLTAVPVDTELVVTAPEKAGYTFDGWEKDGLPADANIDGATIAFKMPANNVTLNAKYTENAPETYELKVTDAQVTLKDGSAVADLTAVPAGTELVATAPEKEGYTFTGWTATGLPANANIDGATVTFKMPANKVTLNAHYTENAPKTYELKVTNAKVTLKDGSAVADLTAVPEGTELVATAPEKAGYTFDSWEKDGLPADANIDGATIAFKMPANKVTLNAKYIANAPETYELKVTDAQVTLKDGSAVADLTAVPAGTELVVTAPEKEGYTFTGWEKDGLPADANIDGATITFKMPANNVTLKAKYTENASETYTVTMGEEDTKYAVGADVSITAPAKAGETFIGWDADGVPEGTDTNSETITFKMPANNVTLTPQYTKDPTPAKPDDPTPAPGGDSDGGGAIVMVAAVGGAAVGVGAYVIGTAAYLKSVLPAGMAIPANRQQLAVALWTAAGKPATQSTALFNDVAADAAELQAIRWAVDTGLMSAQDGSFKPGSRVGRMEVIRTWKTYQQRG